MRPIKLLLLILTFFILCTSAFAVVKDNPSAPANTADDFTLSDQDGKTWNLSDVLKHNRGVVLAFYPKDDTKGWIRQFVEFQQNIEKYESRKIKVIGINRDSAESHRNFIAKHGLVNLTLLVDEKGKIAKMYDADHWLLPLPRRVYLIIDQKMNIIYRKDMGLFPLLPNQSETLTEEIDRNIK